MIALRWDRFEVLRVRRERWPSAAPGMAEARCRPWDQARPDRSAGEDSRLFGGQRRALGQHNHADEDEKAAARSMLQLRMSA